MFREISARVGPVNAAAVLRDQATGNIARLSVGQGCGVIRTADGREVWFHRNDSGAYAGFNDLAVGDAVTFDLLEDRISGARALRVRRNQLEGRPRTP